MLRSFTALCTASLLAGAAHAVPPGFQDDAEAYLAGAYPADAPGAAVIVVEDGNVVFQQARGLADIDDGTPLTPDTVFRLGSITKQFTAAAIMKLVEEGQISLDHPVSKFLPDYPAPGADATVRQLLNHTSGIQSYTGIPGWMVEENTARLYTTDELIAVFRDEPQQSPPGQAWAYNNSGYVLLGAILERVTGKPWDEVLEREIAQPLGLETIRDGQDEAAMPNMAQGYTRSPEGEWMPAQAIHMSVPQAAGALVGTVGDLAGWAKALHGGEVVTPASYRQMTTATAVPDQDEPVPYGFGLFVDQLLGRPMIGHGGGIFGFSTDSLYIPEEDLFVAVFANADTPVTAPSTALQQLAAMAMGAEQLSWEAQPLDMAAVEPLFGVYDLGDEETRRFYERDGKLYTLRSGSSALEVLPVEGGRFAYADGSLSWFTFDTSGEAPVMVVHERGNPEGTRAAYAGPIPDETPAVELPADALSLYPGTYSLGPAQVVVSESEGSLSAQITGQPPFGLRPVGEHEFEVTDVDARLVFDVAEGKATGLTVFQAGQEIPAQRVSD